MFHGLGESEPGACDGIDGVKEEEVREALDYLKDTYTTSHRVASGYFNTYAGGADLVISEESRMVYRRILAQDHTNAVYHATAPPMPVPPNLTGVFEAISCSMLVMPLALVTKSTAFSMETAPR